MQQHPVDLVFTDIQMPGLTGLQFIKSMLQPPMFILVTAYEKFALESYRLHVIDYLVKPVQLEQFMQACNKAWELYQLKNKAKEEVSIDKDYIFLNVDYSLLKLKFEDINYIEGLRDYIKIHLTNSTKPIVVRMSVSTMEENLPSAKFIRVHKSYIVSVNNITAVRKNSIFLSHIEIPIGITYRDHIDQLINRNSL